MINRTLIRLKILQLLYAYYQNGGKSVDLVEDELQKSMSKAYDLYNYLLLLMVAVTRYADEVYEEQLRINKATHNDEVLSRRFIENSFIEQLSNNKTLLDNKQDKHLTWDVAMDYVKKLYNDIVASVYYKEYMELETVSYADDREVWRKIYKNIILKDERIDEVVEEQNLYWNDDKEVVDTFVLKTIKRFVEENKDEQELIPEFKDEEDREFALRLIRRTILNAEYYRSLISQSTKNWEFSRLAFMDILIMQQAFAEILSFPNIPVTVSINEYVELAKLYSTPRSGSYVNGILDAVTKKLRSEGKLAK